MTKRRPYRSTLVPELAAEILSIPLPVGRVGDRAPDPAPKTIGENLRQAVDRLHEAVDLANDTLDSNRMVRIVAMSIAKTLKRRGEATISVEPDGSVVLRVDYPTTVPEPQLEPEPELVLKGKWGSELPSLEKLREDAEDLGVDISDLGRGRRAIHERVQEARTELWHMDEVRLSAPHAVKVPTNGPGHVEGNEPPVCPAEVGTGHTRGS